MRDKRGRFTKCIPEGTQFAFCLPSIKEITYYILILLVFLPWIVICHKSNIFQKIFDFFEILMAKKIEDSEATKKKDYSISIIY